MRSLVVATTALTMAALGPVPAHAATYIEVSASDVQAPISGCRNATVGVDGDWAGASNLIEIEIYDPYGELVWTDSRDVLAGSGHASFTYPACSGDETGWYTVDATMTEYDGAEAVIDVFYDYTEFKVTQQRPKKKRARLTLRTGRIQDGAYRTAAVGDLNVLNAPPRWDRRKKVHLLAYADEWLIIDSARTNRHGKVGWRFKPNPYAWAMCSAPTAKVRTDCTRVFRTRGSRGLTLPPTDTLQLTAPQTVSATATTLRELTARR